MLTCTWRGALAGLLLSGLSAHEACAWPWGGDQITPSRTHPKTTPWDLKVLSRAPAFEWLDRTSRVWSLQYDGLARSSQPTRVFAYYGLPKIEAGKKVPAMVLVHGGGGSAYSS